MQTRKPSNASECKDALKFLDYLRKSQCTQLTDNIYQCALPAKPYPCAKTLIQMEDLAEGCLELTGNKRKR